MKFIPEGKMVMENGTMDFVAPKFATISPLALNLFTVTGINRVFYGKDFISLSKTEEADWNEIKPQIFSYIMDHYTKNQPLFVDKA
jgi:hypothetical protein